MRDGGRRLLEPSREQLDLIGACPGASSFDGLVEDEPKGVEVGALIEPSTGEDLRSAILRGPNEDLLGRRSDS